MISSVMTKVRAQARRRRRGGGRRGARRPRRGGRRRRRRRAPRPRGRGRAGGHPPLRLHPHGLRRLALVGHGRPGAPRQKTVTVDEIVLVPGDEAIVAPEWVPYQRADPARRPVARRPAARRGRRPAAGPDVLLRRRPARRRRQGPGPQRSPQELGLGRVRTLSLEGRDLAAQRWYDGDGGPDSPLAQAAPDPARPAASCSGSPARSRRCSASAPTATPTTTAGSSPSTTAAARTPRSSWPRSTSRSRCRTTCFDTVDDRRDRDLLSSADPGSGVRGPAPAAFRRRRQYSSPNRPSPKPARQVQSHHRCPASSRRP